MLAGATSVTGVHILKHISLRHVLMLVALSAIIIFAAVFRRFGLGEFALLLGFIVLVFLVEAGIYVARRFMRGLRGRE